MSGVLTWKAFVTASIKTLKWLSGVLYSCNTLKRGGETWWTLKKKRRNCMMLLSVTYFRHRNKGPLWNHFDIENQGLVSELRLNIKLLASIFWFSQSKIQVYLQLIITVNLSITSHCKFYERTFLNCIHFLLSLFFFLWHLTYLSHSKDFLKIWRNFVANSYIKKWI